MFVSPSLYLKMFVPRGQTKGDRLTDLHIVLYKIDGKENYSYHLVILWVPELDRTSIEKNWSPQIISFDLRCEV